MTCIAFFGHDASDAAVRRRVQSFRDDGLAVTGFMMRRRDEVNVDWDNIDLGRTFDGKFRQRIGSIWRGAQTAARHRGKLAAADVIYARNLDMLITAFIAKRMTGLKTPVIYEALDVHRLLTREDALGLTLRRVEGAFLSRSRKLVVSSPGFLRNYFEPRHSGHYCAKLIENRLAAGADYGPRPQPEAGPRTGQPLRIGWVGMLRCWRSFGLLLEVARRYGKHVQIVMHGIPVLKEIPRFHEDIRGLPNVVFHGAYKSPEDLATIYAGLDLVWAGDFMEEGYNSKWLLPNRLYEGGYYGVPPIAPEGTETAEWIRKHDIGFVTASDEALDLPDLIGELDKHRDQIAAMRSKLLDLPVDTFVTGRGEFDALIRNALDGKKPCPANLHQSSTRDAGINRPPAPSGGALGE